MQKLITGGNSMKSKNSKILKLTQTALFSALCFVSFTFIQIKIPVPGGGATSLHIGNASVY
jgi:uncharacterized membrane protein